MLLVINKIDLVASQADLEAKVTSLEGIAPQRRSVPNQCQGAFQRRQPHGTHRGSAPRVAALLRQGRIDRQARALLRHRDHPGEDTAQLRQGGALLHRGDRREVRRKRGRHPHHGRHLRGTRLPEGAYLSAKGARSSRRWAPTPEKTSRHSSTSASTSNCLSRWSPTGATARTSSARSAISSEASAARRYLQRRSQNANFVNENQTPHTHLWDK